LLISNYEKSKDPYCNLRIKSHGIYYESLYEI